MTKRGLSAIREASRHHLGDVRELVIDVLDEQQLKHLGDASPALLAAFETHPS